MRIVPTVLWLTVGLFLVNLPQITPAHAANDKPRGTYQWIDDESPRLEDQVHTSNIIYLNRCLGGCTIQPGGNDSRTNRSRIVGRTSTVQPWRHSDEAWDELVACVRAMYDPFDIVVTDVDPGNTPHFESITAGVPQDIGLSGGIGGIAPFSCGVVNNAISFSFANYYGSVADICETVAQETAHSFGLEHAFLCTDPMTYLADCGTKWFQNENVSCGEYSPQACQCRENQNSHRLLIDHFGPGPNAGPDMKFVRPLPNSNVEPGFNIEVKGDYYFDIEKVEVLVNGESVGSSSVAPFIFNSPDGLDGIATIEVRAADERGTESSDIIEVNVGSPCSNSSCPDGRVCYKDFCVQGPEVEGGFGWACGDNKDCDSNTCATDSMGMGVCTDVCELNNGDCPAGYGCVSAGDTAVCWPGIEEESDDGGCSVSGGGATGATTLLLVLVGLLVPRRRRA